MAKFFATSLLIGLVAWTAGCDQRVTVPAEDPMVTVNPPAAGRAAPMPVEPANVEYLPGTSIDSMDTASPSAVEKALDTSQKLNEAMEKLLVQQKQNVQMHGENQRLREQIDRLEAQLAKSRTELDDANAMLMLLRKDLAKWKENVLGYRQEMQQALLAIMKSQQQILTLLGAGNGQLSARTGQTGP